MITEEEADVATEEFTPSSEQVRNMAIRGVQAWAEESDSPYKLVEIGEEFDRWLRKIRAEEAYMAADDAYDQGYSNGYEHGLDRGYNL